MLEEHRLATLGTQEFGRGLCLAGLRVGFTRSCWSRELSEVLLQGCQANTLGGGEEPIVADFDEACGQNMLQEPMDELLCTQLLQSGYDIRTIQEPLGHKDVKTTMIYTHVLQRGGWLSKVPWIPDSCSKLTI